MAALPPSHSNKEKENEIARHAHLSNEKTALDEPTRKRYIAKNREPIIQAHYLIFKSAIAQQHVNELSDEIIREHLEWLEEAAAIGYSQAQFDLAMAHQVGNVLPTNSARTMVWLKLAATSELKQHEEAKRILEGMRSGKTEFDYQKEQAMIESAIQIYRKELDILERQETIHLKPIFSKILTQVLEKEAAESGNANIQYELSLRYGTGLGVAKKGAFANDLLKKAALGGCAHAQIALAQGLSIDRKDSHDADLAKDDKAAFEWFQRAALLKDPHGEYWLADCYFNGKGVAADQVLGKKWLLLSVAQGCALAQYKLSICCFLGKHGFAKDLSQAVHWATEAATNTKPLADAQLLLGSFYETGIIAKDSNNINDIGVLVLEKNLESACFCYNVAALGGHADARQALLRLIGSNSNLEKKLQKAFHTLEPVRKNTTTSSQAVEVSELTSFILRDQNPYRNSRFPIGINLKKLEEIRIEAQSMPSSAAADPEKNGDVKVVQDLVNNELIMLRKQVMLIEFYRVSMLDFITEDSSGWIEEAAAIGNAEAQIQMVTWYERNVLIPVIPERVLFLLEQAIQKGSAAAKTYLDYFKKEDPELFKNARKETIIPNALKLYDEELSNLKGKSLVDPIFSKCQFKVVTIQASEKNDAKSQYELSYRYLISNGCEEDLKASRYWLTKSAENNLAIAQITLAHYLSSNPNLPKGYQTVIPEKDDKTAFHWYERAAALDPEAAATYMGYSHFEGRGVQKDISKGLYWLGEASKYNNSEAQWELYLCYYDGKHDVKKNKTLASEWLIKTAENDENSHPHAHYTLGHCYEFGALGFAVNLPLAYYWYNKAALLKDKDAENALRKLKRDHSKEISGWAKSAAIKSKSAQLSKTVASKNKIAAENDSEDSAQAPRDWLREQDLANNPRKKNTDLSVASAGQKPKDKTRSIFNSGLVKPEDLSAPPKTTARKSPSEDASQKPGMATRHTKDPEAEALKLKVAKEKEDAVLKAKCDMLYFEFFSISKQFLELTGPRLENLHTEIYANKTKIIQLVENSKSQLETIEKQGLVGAAKNIQRQAKGELQSNEKRATDAKKHINRFEELYGIIPKPALTDIKGEPLKTIQETTARFREVFEEAQVLLPKMIRVYNLTEMESRIDKLKNCQSDCEKTMKEINNLASDMSSMVQKLKERYAFFSLQEIISNQVVLDEAAKKERDAERARESLLKENIQEEARKQQESEERAAFAKKLVDRRIKWAEGAEKHNALMAMHAEERAAKKAAKDALKKAREEAKKAQEESGMTKTIISEQMPQEDAGDAEDELEEFDESLAEEEGLEEDSGEMLESSVHHRPKPTLPSLGTDITTKLETIQTRARIERFLSDFRNLIQDETQFTFSEENRELEGYAALGAFCQCLDAMKEARGALGIVAREARISFYHGNPKHVNPHYPKEVLAKGANLKTNQNLKEIQGKESGKDPVNLRFVEMVLKMLSTNWGDARVLESVTLPEEFAKYVFYPRIMKSNQKFDLYNVTVKELSKKIEEIDKENKKKRSDHDKASGKPIEETRQKIPELSIETRVETYEVYHGRRQALNLQKNADNGRVLELAVGYLEAVMSKCAKNIKGRAKEYNEFLRTNPNRIDLRKDPDFEAVIIRGRDFRHAQVQVEAVYPDKAKKTEQDHSKTMQESDANHAHAKTDARANTCATARDTANTQRHRPTRANRKGQSSTSQVLRYPYMADCSDAANPGIGRAMQGAYFVAATPTPYVPNHPIAILFSSASTVYPETYITDPRFIVESSSRTSALATASAAQPDVSHAQSTKAATSKSKVLITYYNNAITHVNYGKNSNDAQKLFNCLRSTDRTLDIKQLTIDTDSIIEIPVSRVNFGARKGFIPQAQFTIVEVDIDASAPVSNLSSVKSNKS